MRALTAQVMGLAAAEGEEGLDEVVKASGYLHAVSQQASDQ